MTERLKVDMIACDGHGVCAELVPELVGLDEWGYPMLADATRDQVRAAIAELASVRNSSAAQLRAGTSRSLGLIVLDMANPFFHDVARGVEDVAERAGYAVVLCNSDEQATRE